MAVFLLKAKFGAGLRPADMHRDRVRGRAVHRAIFDPTGSRSSPPLGITGGCGGGNYCPDTPVTRAQMAVFLLKTLLGSALHAAGGHGQSSTTCRVGSFADAWIEDLYARGVTGGCSASPLLYCPDGPNTRGQMAVFLVKTFDLWNRGSFDRMRASPCARVQPRYSARLGLLVFGGARAPARRCPATWAPAPSATRRLRIPR